MRLTEPALPQDSEATPGAASTIPTSTTPRLLVPVAATRPSLPAPSPSLPDAETAPVAVAPTIPATASGFPPGYAAPTSWYARRGKRLFDLALTSCVLVVAAPVMLGVFVALRFAFPGESIVLRQRRVGLNGQDFDMLKFRTMRPSRRQLHVAIDGPDRRVTHKSDTDPRHTRIGRLLRQYSIDELPQLLNVMRGDMSLVGPRPELSTVADEKGLRYHPRYLVAPGLTGEWQVTLRQSGAMLFETVDEDLPYLGRVTLRNDLSVLVRTLSGSVLGGGR